MNTRTAKAWVLAWLLGVSSGVSAGTIELPSVAKASAKWTQYVIPVCWENPDASNDSERQWVRDAVANTWEKYSLITFVGWQACTTTSLPNGVRVLIEDGHPAVQRLGQEIADVRNGMLLNFTFAKWKQDCQSRRQFCIQTIAVHEFGHALGFTHEQNRSDAPSGCRELAQGSNGDMFLTPYDLSSVMNYCNPNWSGDGKLSASDIEGVRKFYGSPVAKFNIGTFSAPPGYDVGNGQWVSADFDGDGKADLVHLVAGTNYVRTWRSLGGGKFAIGQFIGPAGCAVGNGQWVAADFDGDGKTDLVHLVAGTNYVHTWRSLGDGRFAIGQFSALAGYAVGNGQWVAADFDGDGKTDLVHLVAGTNYVHPWRSRGDGTFDIGQFFASADYAVGSGQWVAADFDGDGKTDLVHLVAGTNYVHPWRSKGNGQFEISQFFAPPGYAVGNGRWVAADFDGDGKVDLVHLVSDTNYLHPWKSLGNGQFEIGQFRAWIGYNVASGNWVAAKYDGGRRAHLVHAVAGGNDIHTWTSIGP
jgi:FG-GAP-like repeat